uniref:FtsK domain-containing protein n=1 Tax=Thermosporothrix sp. COM3 TaxID=2490863 RepID=A0A455T038_9CHLR|nr:hypothetical protein KTC_65060 [Thermosporothrix sp. COM3]
MAEREMQRGRMSPSFLLNVALPVALALWVTASLLWLALQWLWERVSVAVTQHAGCLVGLSALVLSALSAPWVLPLLFRGLRALDDFSQSRKDRAAYRALLEASTEAVRQGRRLEYRNTQTGDQMKVDALPARLRPASEGSIAQEPAGMSAPPLPAAVEAIPAVIEYPAIRDQVPAGQTLLGIHPETGQLELASPEQLKTAWFVGGSNSGKSNTVYGKVQDVVSWGAKLLLCDLHAHKPDSLARKLAPFRQALLRPVATTAEEIKQAILLFLTEFRARRAGRRPCTQRWLIVFDEVNATCQQVVRVSEAERADLYAAFGLKLSEEQVKLQVFIKCLAETCGYETRGFAMYGFFISQKVAGLAWLRNAMMTVFVHALLMHSEALLAANHKRQVAEQVTRFRVGRTLVYGYEIEEMILQQPRYAVEAGPLGARRPGEDVSLEPWASSPAVSVPGNGKRVETGAETEAETGEETAPQAGRGPRGRVIEGVFPPSSAVPAQKERQGAVSAEVRETIRRLCLQGKLSHREIAAAVGLAGRKYGLYQQVCRELGIKPQEYRKRMPPHRW